MCLWCDRPLVVFDDETEREANRLHVVLERVGPPVLGVGVELDTSHFTHAEIRQELDSKGT